MAGSYYDVKALKQYIASNAARYGLDPATALKVWTGEGLSEGVWQSNIVKNGVREPSYGPFQFYTGGGMGNEFQKATGLDPRDPKNVYAMADYAMAHAGKHGWGQWYAARDQGIGPWQGIAKGKDMPTPDYTALANMGQSSPHQMPPMAAIPSIFSILNMGPQAQQPQLTTNSLLAQILGPTAASVIKLLSNPRS